MKFQPKTEKELAEEGLMPEGTVCDFEVVEAEEATSKAGNPMIALKLKVWRPSGSTTLMRDWLVSSQHFKLIAFANATGMRDAYDAGAMDADAMIGRCGKAKIGIDPAKDDYPARNRIAGYIKADAPAPARQSAPARSGGGKAALDDGSEIPF